MELRHLRYFAAAVEEGSLQNAARRMHVAQPALSRRIRDLEADLECTLLERSQRGVTPTKAGILFYREVIKLLDGLTDASELVRSMGRTQEGEVQLGLIHTSRRYPFIHAALSAFRSENPGTTIAPTYDVSPRLADALREKRLDLTFLYENYNPPGLGHRKIHRERMVLAAHPDHPLAQAGPAALSELAGIPLVWLAMRDSKEYHSALMQQMRLNGVEPLVARTAGSMDEMIDLVCASGGAFVTAASTMALTPPRALVFRPLPELKMELHLSLAWQLNLENSVSGKLLAGLLEAIDRYQADLVAGRHEPGYLHGHQIVSLPSPG